MTTADQPDVTQLILKIVRLKKIAASENNTLLQWCCNETLEKIAECVEEIERRGL